MENELEILRDQSGTIIERDITARKLTSYAVGGKIRYLVTVDDIKSIEKALNLIKTLKLDYFFIGAGTNLLISEDGFNGACIKLGERFKSIERKTESSIYAGGAVLVSDLIQYLRKNEFGGLSFLSGIPGSIGGAIAMNAGAFGDEIANHVISVDAVSADGEIIKLQPVECDFGYRQSRIKSERFMVLGVELSVIPEKKIDSEIDECISKRLKNHIPGSHYAGSVFKNPSGNYAGKLIDDCGLKGLRVGSAYISEKHANFIIADPDGSASDVLELMKIAAVRVYNFFGIKLEPEIQLLGFNLNWHDIFE